MKKPRTTPQPPAVLSSGGLDFEITKIYCAVPVTKKQWDKMMAMDRAYIDSTDGSHRLDHALEQAGAEDIEYNGHFGRNLFFRAEDEATAIKVVALFAEILKSNTDYATAG